MLILAIWVDKNFIETAVGNRFQFSGNREIVNDALKKPLIASLSSI